MEYWDNRGLDNWEMQSNWKEKERNFYIHDSWMPFSHPSHFRFHKSQVGKIFEINERKEREEKRRDRERGEKKTGWSIKVGWKEEGSGRRRRRKWDDESATKRPDWHWLSAERCGRRRIMAFSSAPRRKCSIYLLLGCSLESGVAYESPPIPSLSNRPSVHPSDSFNYQPRKFPRRFLGPEETALRSSRPPFRKPRRWLASRHTFLSFPLSLALVETELTVKLERLSDR